MNRRAFTLIELTLALAACAGLLTVIYGFFSNAVHLRNDLMERTREARVRAHAANVIRNDLRNAIVSGGTLAATLEGSQQSSSGSFPGYLKFTTTTAPDAGEVPNPDVQQIEYYIVTDPAATDPKAGMLVRAHDRNLLATTAERAVEEPLLAGMESMEISFYDGSSWQDSWSYTSSSTTGTTSTTSGSAKLPEAVRVRLHPARKAAGDFVPAPIEVLVPWTVQAAVATTATTGATQ